MGGHTALWAVGIVSLVLVSAAASKQHRPVLKSLASAFCGMGALGAVNMLAPFTGVGVVLNYASAFMAVVLGAPGVIAMLLLNLIFGLG